MTKIDHINERQKAKMPEYVDKWIQLGVSTDRPSQETIENIVHDLLDVIEWEKTPVKVVENPIEAWVACCLYEQDIPIENINSEMEKVFDGNPEKRNIPKANLPFQTGSFFAPPFSFYDFIIRELGVKLDPQLMEKYQKWEATHKIGCIYPLKGLTIVCHKPKTIHLNENNVLHKDGAPALTYEGLGDFKIWALNGIRVPQWLAEKSSEELHLEDYNSIENADIKSEFVRKVGIERFIEKGKKIDSYENYDQEEHPFWWSSEYEIYDMNCLFSRLDYAPYLKMLNPTTKIWHLEGISPQCTKLPEAIRDRFMGKELKIVDMA